MKRTLRVGAGVVGVLVGAGFVLPALARMKQLGALPTVDLLLLLMGGTLVALGVAAAMLGLRRKQG